MKGYFFVAVTVALTILLSLTAGASGAESKLDLGALEDALPEDIAESLPEGFFSGNADESLAAIRNALSPSYLLKSLWRLLCGGADGAFSLFAILVALLALTALLSALSDGWVKGEIKSAVAFVSSVCFSSAVVGMQMPRLISSGAFFDRICAAMNSLIPVMAALYLSGGNAGGAALAGSSLVVQINLIELGATFIVMPAVSACMALTLADSLKGGEPIGFSGITSFIKRSVSFILGLCSTLLTASLSAQHILTAAGDSMSARTVKFVAGNMIPVVGSTVGETMKTLAASVKVLRGTVGMAGVCVIALLLLPVITELMLTRLALGAAASIGELMGRRGEARLCREVASLYGYVIAAASLASALCFIALTLFAITSSAIGSAI